MVKPCYTVPQFCENHSISKVYFYQLLKEGRGPRIIKLGRKTLISMESAAEWRARMERETTNAAAA